MTSDAPLPGATPSDPTPSTTDTPHPDSLTTDFVHSGVPGWCGIGWPPFGGPWRGREWTRWCCGPRPTSGSSAGGARAFWW